MTKTTNTKKLKISLKIIILISCIYYQSCCISMPPRLAIKTITSIISIGLAQEYYKVHSLLSQYKQPEKYGSPLKYCFRTNNCITRTKIVSKITPQCNDNIQVKKFDRTNTKDRKTVQCLVPYPIDSNSSISSELIAQTSDGTICGYVDFSRKSVNMIFINYLTVHPNYRRLGVAKKLIQSIEQLNNDKVHKLGLYVSLNNVPAMKLYDALEFDGF